MRNFWKLLKFTVIDLVHQKSFFILLAVSILFVLLLRGCYKQDYTVNGQHISSVTVAWNASIVAFHIISSAALLVAMLLSLGAFRRDKDDGSLLYILSRPVTRTQYLLAKIAGLWAVSFLFMFALHLTILIIAYSNSGGFIPGYALASLVCSLNVLFMVVAISLLSLVLPEFAAALVSIGIVAVGFISDSFFQAAKSDLLKSALQSMAPPTLWRIAWPKIASLQYYAVSLIDNGNVHVMGAIHPLVNVALWIAALGSIFIWRFRREEL
jgi:ABC-type transport system involved in multi-copper enzyme maturation permease subunit